MTSYTEKPRKFLRQEAAKTSAGKEEGQQVGGCKEGHLATAF